LEYVLDEPRSFCLSITRTRAEITRLSAGKGAIENLTERYLSNVRALKPVSDLAKNLSSILIRPIHAAIEKSHFIIVPDGEVYFLPFDALEDSSGKPLVESVDVTPSASVREILMARKRTHPPTRTFLGVGDVAFKPGSYKRVLDVFINDVIQSGFGNVLNYHATAVQPPEHVIHNRDRHPRITSV
jgi:CHAT domain-containing protein